MFFHPICVLAGGHAAIFGGKFFRRIDFELGYGWGGLAAGVVHPPRRVAGVKAEIAGLGVPAAVPCGCVLKPRRSSRCWRSPPVQRRAPLAVYAVGFSPWWSLRLAGTPPRARSREDRMVVARRGSGQRQLPGRALVPPRARPTSPGLCEKNGERHRADAGQGGHTGRRRAERSSNPRRPAKTPQGYDVRAGAASADSGKTPYDVILRSPARRQTAGIGLSRRRQRRGTAADRAADPRHAAQSLRTPRRGVRHPEMIGTEGVGIPVLKVLGGRLDKGFVQDP